jgi:phage tail-like protein
VTPPIVNILESGFENAVRNELGLNGDWAMGLAHRFVVTIDNSSYNFGSWSRASGLSVKWDLYEYRTGSDGNAVQIQPGFTKYERIKLTRAACFDSAIVQQWLVETSMACQPLSGAIYMMTTGIPGGVVESLPGLSGVPMVTWLLREFFPVGWSITDFESSASANVALETLELAHTGFLNDQSRTTGPLGNGSSNVQSTPSNAMNTVTSTVSNVVGKVGQTLTGGMG